MSKQLDEILTELTETLANNLATGRLDQADTRRKLIAWRDEEVKKARENEAKVNLAPLQKPRTSRTWRNRNTGQKLGAIIYFNKVAKTRLDKRLKELKGEK